ncbi:MAG: hypothetical protein IH991_16015 [Planctomycetes bacterium]|nr:hypothetical protein [Planctomycetota bacterium]
MNVTCRANEIIVKVNDDLVNHATNCTVTKGSISLHKPKARQFNFATSFLRH